MAKIVTYAMPGRLFRYRPLSVDTIERELKAVECCHIYCAGHAHMNDPMEGGHRLSAIFSKSDGKQEARKNIRSAISGMGIASLSETKNNEAMWAHYAGNFSGMCVSYKTRSLLSQLSEEIDLVKMNYSEDPPVFLWNSDTPERRAKLALSYKTLRWAQEREWRLFAPEHGAQHYKKIDAVSAVYVGARLPVETQDRIIKRMQRVGITCYRMRIESYTLEFERARKG